MNGHSDILDEAICALLRGEKHIYSRLVDELEKLHSSSSETFGQWLCRKLSECAGALQSNGCDEQAAMIQRRIAEMAAVA